MTSTATDIEVLPPEAHEPLLPIRSLMRFYDDEAALVPHGFIPGIGVLRPVCEGLGVAWSPVLEQRGVLLSIVGGNPAKPTDEGVVGTMSRAGLRLFIRDLQSIDDQLGPDF